MSVSGADRLGSSTEEVRACGPRKGRSCAWPATGPPPEASGNTPDSGSVPGVASVALRGHGFSLADVYRLAERARLPPSGRSARSRSL